MLFRNKTELGYFLFVSGILLIVIGYATLVAAMVMSVPEVAAEMFSKTYDAERLLQSAGVVLALSFTLIRIGLNMDRKE